MLIPLPEFIARFCDGGPRFLIANMIAAGLHVILCVVFASLLEFPWTVVFSSSMLLGLGVNLSTIRPTWVNTRGCGICFGLVSWIHAADAIAGTLLCSSVYRGGLRRLEPIGLVSALCGVMSMVMFILTAWHQNIICPVESADSTRPNNHQHPRCYEAWSYTLGVMSCLIYGMALARCGSGLVPAPGIFESLIGFCTAFLMLISYYRPFNISTWGFVISLFWSLVISANFAVSIVLYRMKAKKYNSRMYYGISFIACLVYALFFDLVFVMKLLLGETQARVEANLPLSTTDDSLKVDMPRSVIAVQAKSFGMQQRSGSGLNSMYGGSKSLKHQNTEETDVESK